MNQALSKEQLYMDLWGRKPISSTNPTVLEMLVDMHDRELISSTENPTLTDEGLQHILYGRNTSELVELLADVGVSRGERVFLANAIKDIIDKPFAYEIIKTSTANPDRETYPSVDLGAYDDVEHGMLFGARTHIMVDPLLTQKNLSYILRKLETFGSKVKGINVDGDTTRIQYSVGDSQREIHLVRAEAMKVGPNITRMVENGISALMMKGWERFREEFGDLKGALDHYSTFLKLGGILLTRWPPEKGIEKIGEGKIAYWVHLNDDYTLSSHGLYLKTAKS
jgi:hypothetical protein|tara:strand:- start:453 stop:1298 length:846 start_codon:yes stop_codon:yes gene_type:complete